METYVRIANDTYIYDNKFQTIEEAKIAIKDMKNDPDMEDVYWDQFNVDISEWRIEEFEETDMGGYVLSRTPFRYMADGENPDFAEFDETETYKLRIL